MARKDGTILVTGANGGLGRQIVSEFLQSPNADSLHGLWGVREPSRATQLQETLQRFPGADGEMVKIDLSTLASVRTAAAEINSRVAEGDLPPLKVLVLNAALQVVTRQSYTEEGNEETVGVNYLSTFLLAILLIQSLDQQDCRIVVVSSWTHDPAHVLNGHVTMQEHRTIFGGSLEPLIKPAADKQGDDYNAGMRRYGASKTLIIMIMYELQRRLSESRDYKNVSVLAVDPGGMPGTSLIRDSSPLLNFVIHTVLGTVTPLLTYLFPNGYFRTPQKSAKDVLKASFDRQAYGDHPKGLYLNGDAIIQSSPETRDAEKQRSLWAQTVKVVSLRQNETVLQIE